MHIVTTSWWKTQLEVGGGVCGCEAVGIMAIRRIWCWNPDDSDQHFLFKAAVEGWSRSSAKTAANKPCRQLIALGRGAVGLCRKGSISSQLEAGRMKRHTVAPVDSQVLFPGYRFESNTIPIFPCQPVAYVFKKTLLWQVTCPLP